MSTYALALPDGDTIQYQLERRPRKTVGMQISPQGLIVHAPNRITLSQLEQLLLSKANWIRNKLQALQESALAPFQWQDGAALRYLGQDIQLSLRHDAKNRAVEFDGARLYLALPNPDDDATVQRKVAQWYRKQALADFTRRIELLAAKLGVPKPPMFLSNARTRWGSCNSRGEIRLHWRLIQAPPHIIHYVVAHELAHLKEMNHSPKFWAWVGKLCPEYKMARQGLKALSVQLHLV